MRSMTWSRCLRRGLPEGPLPLQIEATNWPPANEIDACNDDLVVTITEVIAEHTNPTRNHLSSSEDYLDSNPKTLEECGEMEKDGSPPLLVSGRRTGEEEGEEP